MVKCIIKHIFSHALFYTCICRLFLYKQCAIFSTHESFLHQYMCVESKLRRITYFELNILCDNIKHIQRRYIMKIITACINLRLVQILGLLFNEVPFTDSYPNFIAIVFNSV